MRVAELINRLESLRIERLPHRMLLRRKRKLRHNSTAWDAAYIALATGHNARVTVFSVH